MGTRVTRTFDMCPCKRATGPAALQSRHLPRVEGVGFTGRKQATIRGVGFHFPRAFFSRYSLSTLSPRLSTGARARVSSVFSSLSLSLAWARVPPPPPTRRRPRVVPRTSAGLLVTRAPVRIIKIPKRAADEGWRERWRALCPLARGQSGPLVDSRVN